MRYLLVPLAFVLSAFSCSPSVPLEAASAPASDAAPEDACPAMPEKYLNGYLSACAPQDVNPETECCGYAFLSRDQLCFHVLCAMKKCEPFQYNNTICVDANKTSGTPLKGESL